MAVACSRRALLLRFWRSASGFWLGPSARLAWLLSVALVLIVLLQLLVQYELNFWSRDFFNAIEQKDQTALRRQAFAFVPLAAASLSLAVLNVWSRMTTERRWRHWLSHRLYDLWLCGDHHIELQLTRAEPQTPEYRIAEDARTATDLPIDLVLGLLSSVMTALAFIGVLWSVGGSLELELAGFRATIAGYLVVAVIAYSASLTSATLLLSRRLTRVIEENKAAEAELRATGTRLRSIAAGDAECQPDGRRAIGRALDLVIQRWQALCWQMMRLTAVSHSNVLIAPSISLLLCTPKYLAGEMTLGAVVQAAAAFVAVQGAFGWLADSYGRIAEWAASASRVASLLISIDEISERTRPARSVRPEHAEVEPGASWIAAPGLAPAPSFQDARSP